MYIEFCYQCRLDLVTRTVLNGFYDEQKYISWLQLALQHLSGLSLMFMGLYLLLGTNFKKHPYPLLAWACIFESALFFNWSQKLAVIQFKLHKILAVSLYGGDLSDFRITYECLKKLILCWKVLFATLLQLNIVTNGLIYIDLYLTLKNPFYPRSRRAKKYYIIMLSVFLVSSSISYYTYTNNTFTLKVYDKLFPLST